MNKNSIIKNFFLALSLFPTFIESNNLQANGNQVSNPVFRQVSTEQGLSQNSVNSFYEDSDGFVWLSTDAGVNQFDGIRMVNNAVINQQYKLLPLNAFSKDNKNRLWLVGNDGLVIADPSTKMNKRIKFPSNPQRQAYANVLLGIETLDEQSTLVFSRNGVYHVNAQTNDISQPISMQQFLINSDALLSYAQSTQGYWLGSNNALYFFDPVNDYIYDFELPNTISKIGTIFQFSENNLLISDSDTLWHLTLKKSASSLLSITKVEKVANAKITSVSQSKEKLYFSTENEIYWFNKESNRLEKQFSIADNLSKKDKYRIRSLFLDSRNLLWIGTESQGAFIWNTNMSPFKNWKIASPERSSKKQLIWDIEQDKDENFWVASGSELMKIARGKDLLEPVINFETLQNTNKEIQIYSLIHLKGHLWLATNQGLYHYDIASGDVSEYLAENTDNLFKQSFYSITSSDSNTLWLAGTGGLVKFDISRKSFSYVKAIMPEYDAQKIRHVSFQNNQLWIDLPEQLISYDIEQNIVREILPIRKNKLGERFPMTDLKLYDNNLWVSFKGDGIYLLKFDKRSESYKISRHFHTSSGFYDNHIYSIEKDHNFIWATSTQGIIKINAEEYGTDIYNAKHGVISNEFNEGASLVGTDGNLYFGSLAGLISIEPNIMVQETSNKEIFIYSVLAVSEKNDFNLPISDSALEIPADIDELYVDFTIFDYMNNGYHNIDYWIAENKPKKVSPSTQLRVDLRDVKVGKHQLNIRSYSASSPSNTITSQMMINIIGEENSALFWIKKQLHFIALLLLLCTVILVRRSKRKIEFKEVSQNQNSNRRNGRTFTHQNDFHGTWECTIERNDYLNSMLTIYHNKRKPIALSLGEYLELVDPSEVNSISTAWKHFLLGHNDSIKQTHRTQFYEDWHWNEIQGEIRTADANGSPVSVAGTWTDITKEKENENALKLYNNAFNRTQDIVFILNINFDIVDVNQAFQHTTGFSTSPLIGKNLIQLASNRVSVDYLSRMKNFILENKKWSGDGTLPRRNAPSMAVNIRANSILDGDIESGYIVVMTDIRRANNIDKSMNNTSFYDQVTGLPNKAIAFDKLRELLQQSKENNNLLSIIFLSIEPYESLKAQFDETTLDSLLLTISSRIIPYVQADDLLARYEENTFLLLLNGEEDDKSIPHTINQLLGEMAKPFEIDDQIIEVSACAGISNFPYDGSSWSELITKSETALEQTKQQGSNLFKYYHEESNLVAKERVKLENKLKIAIENDEIFLVFQPILDLDSMNIVELDASIRWRSEANKIVYPNHFLKVAERIGLRDEFDSWYIEKSLLCLKRWHQEGLKYCINLNLSLKYLADKKHLIILEQAIQQNEIDPKWVYLSITEDELADNNKSFDFISKKINALGVGIVLDGFGRNNTSFKLLETFNFHSVKLARLLTREISNSKFNDLLLSGIISLLNDLGIGSVAKGIEEKEQLDFLKRNQCRYGQGFIFSDPLNENQTRQYLLNSKLG